MVLSGALTPWLEGKDVDLNSSLQSYPYSSRRFPTLSSRGMVTTSQPLAAQAGLAVLRRGGNAIDAAIATAITLTVVEPTSNGIGGDVFALIWDGNQLHGLNGSGRAPAGLSVETVRDAGFEAIPTHGWLSVTVPGAPRAWRDLHARWGKLPFESLFEDAISYAQEGFPISVKVARYWKSATRDAAMRTDPEYRGWHPTFAPSGFTPEAGKIWSSQSHAQTLREIANSGAESFYRGRLADAIEAFSADTGGILTKADLAAHTSTWVDPITTNYRGYNLWEIPPNGQGITALIALNILEGFDLRRLPRDSVESQHLQIEAIKLAFADTQAFVGDPGDAANSMDELWASLLDKSYAAQRRRLISSTAAVPPVGQPMHGGTVYLCTADSDGLMVSLIQSNYGGIGSGIVIPDTGIALQNRGGCFTLKEGHPNHLAPGKRPFHTIIPAFLTRDGEALGPIGVPGGHMQPQAHVQLVTNMVDYDLNPQASIDAPRWQWTEGLGVDVELMMQPQIIRGLLDRGHSITVRDEGLFGSAQMIFRLPTGGYIAGCETRVDSVAYGY